jgi:hypothetical protein
MLWTRTRVSKAACPPQKPGRFTTYPYITPVGSGVAATAAALAMTAPFYASPSSALSAFSSARRSARLGPEPWPLLATETSTDDRPVGGYSRTALRACLSASGADLDRLAEQL